MMRAMVRSRFGSPDVLELKDIDRPVVADDGLLVRVRACGNSCRDHQEEAPVSDRGW